MIYDIIVYIASIFFFTAIIREVLASLNRVSSIKQKIGETSQAKEAMKKLKLVKTPLSFAFMTSIVIGILLAFEASLNFKKWTTANELLMSGVYINICRMNAAAAKAAGMNWEHITPYQRHKSVRDGTSNTQRKKEREILTVGGLIVSNNQSICIKSGWQPTFTKLQHPVFHLVNLEAFLSSCLKHGLSSWRKLGPPPQDRGCSHFGL